MLGACGSWLRGPRATWGGGWCLGFWSGATRSGSWYGTRPASWGALGGAGGGGAGKPRGRGALRRAVEGVEAAYYLVHAMLSERAFQEAERRQAEAFARVAREAGLSHVVYLGGSCPRRAGPPPT